MHIKEHFRCFLAEFLGTFFLTLADAGVAVAAELAPHDVTYLTRALTPGLTVMAVIFTLGELSGAHINPAVTVGFFLRGVFPLKKVPGYLFSQVLGAVSAVLILRASFDSLGNLGATIPEYASLEVAFLYESLLTFMLVFVILNTSHQSKIKGPESAFPVGAIITVCSLIGKDISGASMNPARSLGPVIVSGNWHDAWIYVSAPIMGAIFAVLFMRSLHGPPKFEDIEAAQGEKNVSHEKSHV